MTFDTETHVKEAAAALQMALAELEAMHTAYHAGPGAAFAAAQRQSELIASQLQAAEKAAEEADDAYHQMFAAGGYTGDAASGRIVARRTETASALQALQGASNHAKKMMLDAQMAASGPARDLVWAYKGAQRAFVSHEVANALHECGPALARAMALLAQIPVPNGIHEDFLGRPAPSAEGQRQQTESRWQFVGHALKQMAYARPEINEPITAEALGEFDLGALRVDQIMSPIAIRLARVRMNAGTASPDSAR